MYRNGLPPKLGSVVGVGARFVQMFGVPSFSRSFWKSNPRSRGFGNRRIPPLQENMEKGLARGWETWKRAPKGLRVPRTVPLPTVD